MGHVNVINENWQKVIAESVFKYAGSTYKSLVALESVGNADLAKEFEIKLIPFLLDGVALNPELNLDDGMHPNEKGIKIISGNIEKKLLKIIN